MTPKSCSCTTLTDIITAYSQIIYVYIKFISNFWTVYARVYLSSIAKRYWGKISIINFYFFGETEN